MTIYFNLERIFKYIAFINSYKNFKSIKIRPYAKTA